MENFNIRDYAGFLQIGSHIIHIVTVSLNDIVIISIIVIRNYSNDMCIVT